MCLSASILKTSWQTAQQLWQTKKIPPPAERTQLELEEAGWISLLLFQWINPLMSTGYERSLQLNDMPLPGTSHEVDRMLTRFKAALQDHTQHNNRTRRLVRTLIATFRTELINSAACFFVAESLTIITPFVLLFLLDFVQALYLGQSSDMSRGIGLVVGITCLQVMQSLCLNHYYFRVMMLGAQIRSTLIAHIADKATRLSRQAKTRQDGTEHWDDARINNLMSTDTSRIEASAATVHRLWMTPIQILLALILLCINLGPSALVGLALIIIMVPLLSQTAKSLNSIRQTTNRLTDERVRLIVETFSSIRMVKIFAWEDWVTIRLADVRQREIHSMILQMMLRNGILIAASLITILATTLSFVTYYLIHGRLSTGPIFSSLALFNNLTAPLENLPLALGRAIDAYVACGRISAFLDAEEWTDQTTYNVNQSSAVIIDNATFLWTASAMADDQNAVHDADAPAEPSNEGDVTAITVPRTSAFALQDIKLTVEQSELIAVIGDVGSGKTALLTALAGQMHMTQGCVTVNATRALCNDVPWIQNAPIRDNITFGRTFRRERYNAVVNACALEVDLAALPDGDLTQVGERGITLSGGQKQRINLARAIYADTDIILLDDPLSAVDSQVGQHIMQEAICGLLRGKCRIMATHQIHILPLVNRIIWLRGGLVHKVSTYDDMMRCDAEFRALVSTSSTTLATRNCRTVARGDVEATVADPTIDHSSSEEQEAGRVARKVYLDFMKSSGSLWNVVIVVVLMCMARGLRIVDSLWLSWWASDRFAISLSAYIGIYLATGIVSALMTFLWATSLTTYCLRASRALLGQAVIRAIRAPISFYDVTPLGRIIDRFSKDVDTIDNRLVEDLLFFLYILSTVSSVFALVLSYYWYFMAALVPLIVVCVRLAAYYRPSARAIKCHEAVLRSTVFSRFNEAVSGTSTIQAYMAASKFQTSIRGALDSMDGAYFLTFAGQRWLSIRLDAISNLLILVVGMLIITSPLRGAVNPNIAGLIMAYMLTIGGLIQDSVQAYSDVQNDMNSVERLHFYAHDLKQEPTVKHNTGQLWSQAGAIVFNDVSMRHREGLPLVLRQASFSIASGEKIGIIGRTGAGKSSIFTAILRLVELDSGHVDINGVNTVDMDPCALRSRLAVISQGPSFITGTVRSNLDPLGEHDDLTLWHALRKCHPSDGNSDKLGLDSAIEVGGCNLSLGQRQLLALARALVKDAHIVLCDEMSSAVDLETDLHMQHIILREFADKTVLCIAHRLRSILSYDKILVMEAGRVNAYDTPLTLFDGGGTFRSMCDGSGISRLDILHCWNGAAAPS